MSDLKKRLLPMEQLEMPELWADIERRRPRFQPDEPEPGWRRVAIAVAALAIAVGAVALAVSALSEHADRVGDSPEIPTPLAQNGVIAYAGSGREGIFWTVSPDGRHRSEVRVRVPGSVGLSSWSPDGTRIAFDVQSYDEPQSKGGSFDIYVADADGSDPVRLTTDHAARSPAWSPDGTKIAYMRQSSGSEIWVMNVDGSNAHRLVAGWDGYFPSWSPDGSRLAFVSMDGTDANIYTVNEDGSDVRRLTDDPAHEDRPAWSPDGGTIAYTSEGGSREPGVYTVGTDGTGVRQLLSDEDPANLGFAWSPNGTSMAIVGITGPRSQRTLSVMDVATRQLKPIADPGAYFGPSWQPLPPGTDRAPEQTSIPSPAATYPPPTQTDGNLAVMAVTFPDGTTADLEFDPTLELGHHGVGIAPTLYAESRAAPACGSNVIAAHASLHGQIYEGPRVAELTPRGGTTTGLWKGAPGNLPYYLVFRVDGWDIIVPCNEGADKAREDLAMWASAFHIAMTEDGLLRFSSDAPVTLFPYDGPELVMGGAGVHIDLTLQKDCSGRRDDTDASDYLVRACFADRLWLYAQSDGRDTDPLATLIDTFDVRSLGSS
jgi:TolB protein